VLYLADVQFTRQCQGRARQLTMTRRKEPGPTSSATNPPRFLGTGSFCESALLALADADEGSFQSGPFDLDDEVLGSQTRIPAGVVDAAKA
jgi:hypothetical protein